MRIPIKTGRDIQAMRRSGAAVSAVLDAVGDLCVPGTTTGEIDAFVGRMIAEMGGRSAFLGYRGFPGHCCVSVNEEIVHGIGGARRLRFGDIVKIDCGIILDGWIGDSARTFPVGAVTDDVQRLMDVTLEALYQAIDQARSGQVLGAVCHAVERHVVRHGYSVVREFVGHGVGRKLHEQPQIPNYGDPRTGPKLRPGMVLAIEPMVNMGGQAIVYRQDNWTVATADGKPSAHFEHTVLVTDGEPEILTCSSKMALK